MASSDSPIDASRAGLGNVSGLSWMQAREGRLLALCVLLTAMVLVIDYWDTLNGAFLGDARFLILENAYIAGLDRLWDNLTHDYFWSSAGNTLPYWRPLTKAQWVLQWQLFGPQARGYHAVQLAWLIVGSVGVLVLTRRITADLRLATCAALLWGLSAVAIEPVHLLMASSDVVAASCAPWCVFFLLRWRSDAGLGNAAGHGVFWVLGLGCKEVTVVLLPLLLLLCLFAPDSTLPEGGSSAVQREQRRRSLYLWASSAAIAALYLVFRSSIVRSGPSIDWNPHRWVVSLGSYLWQLFPLRVASSLRGISRVEALDPLTWFRVTLALAVVAAVATWSLRRRKVWPLLCLLWLGLVLGPVLAVKHLNLPGMAEKFPLADRWAFHAVAPTVLISVFLLSQWSRGAAALVLICVLWVPTTIALRRPEHRLYRSEVSYLQKEAIAYQRTPPAFRTRHDRCRADDRAAQLLLRRGRMREGGAAVARQIEKCGQTPERNFNLLSAYVATGQYQAAKPIVARLKRRSPGDARSHATLAFLLGRLAIVEGDLSRAQGYFVEARRRNYRGCDLYTEEGKLQMAGRQAQRAAVSFTRAARCFGPKLAGAKAWIASAMAWELAQQADKADIARRAAASIALSPDDRAALTAFSKRLR